MLLHRYFNDSHSWKGNTDDEDIEITYLIHMIQLRTGPSTIVRLLPEPFRPDFHSTPTRFATARPIGPLTEFAVWWTWNDASLLNVAWVKRNGQFRTTTSLAGRHLMFISFHILFSNWVLPISTKAMHESYCSLLILTLVSGTPVEHEDFISLTNNWYWSLQVRQLL